MTDSRREVLERFELEALALAYDSLRRLGGWWWRRQVDKRWRRAMDELGIAVDRFEASLAEMRARGDLKP